MYRVAPLNRDKIHARKGVIYNRQIYRTHLSYCEKSGSNNTTSPITSKRMYFNHQIPKIYFQYVGNSQNIGSNYRYFIALQRFLYFPESLTGIAFQKLLLCCHLLYGIPVGYNRT